MYKDNPKYQLLYTAGIYHVYFLKDENIQELHISRKTEAGIQNEYSNAGATAKFIDDLSGEAIRMLEDDPKSETLRQNMIAMWNQLRYRTKYPVDSLCGLRMGAILSFLEYESEGRLVSEPITAEIAWLNKKIQIALADPDAYTFFLTWGIGNTPSYYKHLSTSKEADYFARRQEALLSWNPSVKKSSESTII